MKNIFGSIALCMVPMIIWPIFELQVESLNQLDLLFVLRFQRIQFLCRLLNLIDKLGHPFFSIFYLFIGRLKLRLQTHQFQRSLRADGCHFFLHFFLFCLHFVEFLIVEVVLANEVVVRLNNKSSIVPVLCYLFRLLLESQLLHSYMLYFSILFIDFSLSLIDFFLFLIDFLEELNQQTISIVFFQVLLFDGPSDFILD